MPVNPWHRLPAYVGTLGKATCTHWFPHRHDAGYDLLITHTAYQSSTIYPFRARCGLQFGVILVSSLLAAFFSQPHQLAHEHSTTILSPPCFQIFHPVFINWVLSPWRSYGLPLMVSPTMDRLCSFIIPLPKPDFLSLFLLSRAPP